MIDVTAATDLHRTTVRRWHGQQIDNPHEGFLNLVCCQHQRNYRLWHEEDIARSPDAGDTQVAEVKRKIDGLNQERNDLVEQLDDYLIRELDSQGVVSDRQSRLNTETPGSVIDRLSILALRIYHMEEQAARADIDEQRRQKATGKLAVLYEQHDDLCASLSELLEDLFSGRKRLKVYRQFKMYNDPTMNPYLYNAKPQPAA